MRQRPNLQRLVLAGAILAIAGGTVVGGWRLASFAIDARRLVNGQPEDRQRIGGGADAAIVARLSDWGETLGVRASARELLALDPQLKKSNARRLLDITAALAETPTSGRLWLAYAGQVLRSGYAVRHAVDALRMSQIMERRRAETMFLRALVVVKEWERMPNDLRQASMRELALMRHNMGARERAQMAQVAATTSTEVRAEVGKILIPKLGDDVWVAKAMGF